MNHDDTDEARQARSLTENIQLQMIGRDGARKPDRNLHFDYFEHTAEALSEACKQGANALHAEAAEALSKGDHNRHERKTRAARWVEEYAATVRAGEANLCHAQVVATAAHMSGILTMPRYPDDNRQRELKSAADAGLLTLVAVPGQLAFYMVHGYEPRGGVKAAG